MTRVDELAALCARARHPLVLEQDATSVSITSQGGRLVYLSKSFLHDPVCDLSQWVEDACLSVDAGLETPDGEA